MGAVFPFLFNDRGYEEHVYNNPLVGSAVKENKDVGGGGMAPFMLISVSKIRVFTHM